MLKEAGYALACLVRKYLDKRASYMIMASPRRIEQLVEAIHKRHPEWNKDDIKKALVGAAKYAPSVLLDPMLAEQVVKRIHSYGGMEPAFAKELAEMEKSYFGLFSLR